MFPTHNAISVLYFGSQNLKMKHIFNPSPFWSLSNGILNLPLPPIIIICHNQSDPHPTLYHQKSYIGLPPGPLCNKGIMQYVHYATDALHNTCILQHVHYSTHALCNTCIMQKLYTCMLDRPARWTSWTDQLGGPVGRTSWTDQLDGPAGRTSWTDQLNGPAG